MLKLQESLNSRYGVALGMLLSRLPDELGYRTADWIADRISSLHNSDPLRAVRANQWIVHERRPDLAELKRLAALTYRSSARSLYEYWHNVGNPAAVERLIEFHPSFISCIQQARDQRRGLLLVLPHTGNFDLVGRAASLRGIKLHILSYPNPPGGYRLQNRLRQFEGLKITPLSIESLRMASDTLRAGGIVSTGIDRPLGGEHGKYPVNFFGLPALLPVYHIRLAIKHRSPVAVVGTLRQPNGRYLVHASGPIEMVRDADLVAETTRNAERVLSFVMRDIKRAPEQWAMFYPVWPQIMDQIPQ